MSCSLSDLITGSFNYEIALSYELASHRTSNAEDECEALIEFPSLLKCSFKKFAVVFFR